MRNIIVFALLANILQAETFQNRLELGLKTTAYDYTERNLQGEIIDTENSKISEINGIYGSLDYLFNEYSENNYDVAYYFNIFGSAQYGDTDYVGSLLNSNLPYGSHTSSTLNTFYEFQTNLKRLHQYDNSSLYFTLGLGYKVWERELSSTQLETYYYPFTQVSIGVETKIYNNLHVGLELSGQLAFDAKMDALNETFNLGRVYSYKIVAPIKIPMYEKINFTAKLEYEYANFEKSDFVQIGNFTYYEPDSEQKNWNLYAGVEFLF
ncbi:hypothetical protein HUE87_08420 [Candidatus Sulfurimonas marisnigri]|uniref:Autotransporter domain-containing protein n=1 Tax=Candidatus Sulfurimonas marisnigri TaxID=2740405 RepID=A0A7S7LYP2_9BACT|nr:hypothetical protein [Candidatus Sulfurimonas marisnigri]QOY53918.1 hypothetical protein HUE87_08420 [Candidatus Sulfurimonas marisnigri]